MYQILVVDDDFNLSNSLRFSLSESKNLKVDFFGIDVAKIDKKIFKDTISESFIDYSKKVNISNSYDLLLIDYNMPNNNAKDVIEECKNLPPIIVMSADIAQMQESIMQLLATRAAKRYIFKNSEVFAQELEILAQNVIEERNNIESLNILEELLLNDNIDSFEEFAKELSSKFMQSFPNTVMVVREYDQTDEILKKIHSVDGIELEDTLTKESARAVFCAIEEDLGYCINNKFELIQGGFNSPTLGSKKRYVI